MKLMVVVALLAACGGGGGSNNSQDGTLGGKCYPNSTCNAGLACVGNACETAIDVDAAVSHDSNVVPDAPIVHPDSAILPDAPVVVLIDAGIIDGPPTFDGGSLDAGGTACSVLTQAGCTVGQKCTWILSTDPTSTSAGLGSIGCSPDGTVAVGGACTILPAAQGGYDNCVEGTACVSGICKSICDNNGGIPACAANQACVTYDGLFANEGATTTPAGVCDPQCNPLTDNDFDGSGTAHTKTGSACGSSSTIGCYGLVSDTNTTYFTCSSPAAGTENLTHRSVLPPNEEFVNSCMSGYSIAFASDAQGSNDIDCYAFCSPGEAYLGNTATQLPNGVAPHRCNNLDALGAFGATPSGTAASNGEHCMFSWLFEEDSTGVVHLSPTSNTVGFCFDHSKYQYDSNGDGTPDATLPPCAALPLVPATGALGAADLGCVTTTTAGLSFTGKPAKLHRPYIENMPELRALRKHR